MTILDERNNDVNSKSECGKKNDSLSNRMISTTSRFLVIVWVGASALWSKPYLADYYQKQANSHYDTVQWFQMGPVFIAALLFSIHSFTHKSFFLGVITAIIAVWAFYWAFMASFSCHACTYGG